MRIMKFQKLFILLAAAGSGALVYKVRHPDSGADTAAQYENQAVAPEERSSYSMITGKGSLYQTIKGAKDQRDQQQAEQQAEQQQRKASPYGGTLIRQEDSGNYSGASGGGIGPVGGVLKGKVTPSSSGYNSPYANGNAGNMAPTEDLALLQAAAKGDKLGVQRRLAAGAKVDSRDSERRTPLIYAAANGFEDIIDRLTAAGANPNFKDRNGNNAFDYAAGRGLVETVDYLLKRTHTKDDRHYIEYAQTIRATYAGDVSLLPPGTGKLASINRITPDGQAPLHIAAGNGSVDVIDALVKRGAEVNLTNSNEQTPLHWAAWNNQPGSASALLVHGACVFQGEAAGNTPLMLAAQSNSQEVAKVLLDNGAERDVVNKQGKTAAMQAEDRGFRGLSDILK